MDANALRALQAPLKERYKQDPNAAPVGFRAIRLAIELDTDAPQDKLDALLKLTERYCVVFQTLAGQPQLSMKVARG